MRIKPVKKRQTKMGCKVLNNTVIQLGCDRNCVNVTLHKTIRIPDDGRNYSLPPSLGLFNVYKVDDYRDKVPQEWLKHGGVFVPMFQREALWLKFDCVGNSKHAMKVGVGKINAINGKNWTNRLQRNQNDYIVTPTQPWLDGIATGKSSIRQFVAMPLHEGHTIESQMRGRDEFGGIQLLSFKEKKRNRPIYRPPIRRQIYHTQPFPKSYHHYRHHHHVVKKVKRKSIRRVPAQADRRRSVLSSSSSIRPNYDSVHRAYEGAREMGVGAGGKMVQKVYRDNYGYNRWDQSKCCRMFIHLVNSEMFESITGIKPPVSTITRHVYTQFGYPWLNFYEEKYTSTPYNNSRRYGNNGIGGSRKWKNIKTVDEVETMKNFYHPYHQGLTFVNPQYVGGNGNNNIGNNVRDGNW